eukprot:scaffold2281_cov125-Isochrysis_galbana.AAC.1
MSLSVPVGKHRNSDAEGDGAHGLQVGCGGAVARARPRISRPGSCVDGDKRASCGLEELAELDGLGDVGQEPDLAPYRHGHCCGCGRDHRTHQCPVAPIEQPRAEWPSSGSGKRAAQIQIHGVGEGFDELGGRCKRGRVIGGQLHNEGPV